MIELGSAQLRFTPEESSFFLHDTMGLDVEQEQATLLNQRTEGWIAGLQLAALALHDRVDRQVFFDSFSGSNRYVAEYLAAEVLERLPNHLRTFVVQTSVLDQMCGPLCDNLLGVGEVAHEHSDSYSQIVLEELERKNLFVVPLDDNRRWFRYHTLFSDLLRNRLHGGVAPDDVEHLHQRAANWYEQQGQIDDALRHLVAARDWPRAVQVLQHHGLQSICQGHVQGVLGWFAALPDTVIRTHPLACIVHAIGLMHTNRFQQAEAWLGNVERSILVGASDDWSQVVQSGVAGVRGEIQIAQGNIAAGLALVRDALRRLPATNSDATAAHVGALLRAGWNVALISAYLIDGDVGAVDETEAIGAIAAAQALGHEVAVTNGTLSLARLHLLRGHVPEAMATCDSLQQATTEDAALTNDPAYLLGRGALLYEHNNLQAAEATLHRGLATVQDWQAIPAEQFARGYVALALVFQARGNTVAAFATVDRGVEQAQQRGVAGSIIAKAEALRAMLLLANGNLDAALGWAEWSGLGVDDAPFFPHESLHMTLAQVRIAAGQAATVMPLLDRLLADAEAKGRGRSTLAILLLQALAADGQGQRTTALSLLQRALALAHRGGFVRIVLDQGAPLLPLLDALRDQTPTLPDFDRWLKPA